MSGAASARATPPGPPVAPVRDVADTYFGTKVIDPYRWMETDSPELSTWMKAEADHTRRVLDALPLRAELAARVKALDNAGSLLASALPIQGAVRTLSADPAADGALFPLTSPARGRAPEAF